MLWLMVELTIVVAPLEISYPHDGNSRDCSRNVAKSCWPEAERTFLVSLSFQELDPAISRVRLEVARATEHDFVAELGEGFAEVEHRIHAVRDELEANPYSFDRRFLFRVLAMGHSQFAEYIGARGPNTQVNAACASTTQAVALAEAARLLAGQVSVRASAGGDFSVELPVIR